jgi:hypothetical protein
MKTRAFFKLDVEHWPLSSFKERNSFYTTAYISLLFQRLLYKTAFSVLSVADKRTGVLCVLLVTSFLELTRIWKSLIAAGTFKPIL